MSNTVPTTGLRAIGTTDPTHTAVAGMLYLNRTSGAVFVQQTAPTGSLWCVVNAPGVGSYVPYKVVVNTGDIGSYERV